MKTPADLFPILIPLASRVRTDITAVKRNGVISWTKEPLTSENLLRHINGDVARGVCPIRPGDSHVRVALLDFDNHRDETAPSEMTQIAQAVMDELKSHGMNVIPWRSSGGKGIHFYLLWDNPQDAHSVRQFLRQVIDKVGYRDGTGGVINKQIEIFPKQNEVPVGGYGNHFILPLFGESVPLNPAAGLAPMDRDDAISIQWLSSPPVPLLEKPVHSAPKEPPKNYMPDLLRLRAQLNHINPEDYDIWIRVGMGIHYETAGSDEGREIWNAWSSKARNYRGDREIQYKWKSFFNYSGRRITGGTIITMAREGGWVDVTPEDFDGVCDPANPEVRGKLSVGSDVELANRVLADMTEKYGEIVFDEGESWRYEAMQWWSIPVHDLRRAVHTYDGALVVTPRGSVSYIKLNKSRVDSVLNEMQALTIKIGFFVDAPVGINCMSGFIKMSEDGIPSVEPHNRDHRARHTLPGKWHAGANPVPPEGSMLHRLINGVFDGDDDVEQKKTLVSELCGVAALGYATKIKQPRAAILKGETAENGKSQILDIIRGVLPHSAVCNVTAAKMGDDHHVIALAGKLLNACDELSSAQAVSSEIYKAVITGDPVTGRDVYKPRVEFRPVAQNIFATNVLPSFQGGMDRGVRRRLLVIPFNRVIPPEERIEGIGRRIAEEETDLLLAFAVDGASRVIRQRNFTIPPSSEVALAEWIYGADPVLAWLEEDTIIQKPDEVQVHLKTREAHVQFKYYAIDAGFNRERLPEINSFTQRVKAAGVGHKRTSDGPVFTGLVIKGFGNVLNGMPGLSG